MVEIKKKTSKYAQEIFEKNQQKFSQLIHEREKDIYAKLRDLITKK